jgi:predicted nucleotidyltransferase
MATKLEPRIPIDREALTRFCEKWKISRLEFFGSVLRDDFGPDSDVDVMVTFEDPLATGWDGMFGAQQELEKMLGYRVDMSSRPALERSRNRTLKRYVFGGAMDVVAR